MTLNLGSPEDLDYLNLEDEEDLLNYKANSWALDSL